MRVSALHSVVLIRIFKFYGVGFQRCWFETSPTKFAKIALFGFGVDLKSCLSLPGCINWYLVCIYEVSLRLNPAICENA